MQDGSHHLDDRDCLLRDFDPGPQVAFPGAIVQEDDEHGSSDFLFRRKIS
jgi:hypothetical protein